MHRHFVDHKSLKHTPVYACKVKNNESIFGTLRISLSLHLTVWKINFGSCISAMMGTSWQLSSLLLIRKGLKWINVRQISQILFKLTEDHVCTSTLNSQHYASEWENVLYLKLSEFWNSNCIFFEKTFPLICERKKRYSSVTYNTRATW